MGFDQDVHAEPSGDRHDLGGLIVVEQGEEDEHGVGAVEPRLGNLARVDDEVLGEDRAGEDPPYRAQILERAAEKGRVGEDADCGRGAGVSGGLHAGLDFRPDRTGRWRLLLHLHDEADSRPGEGGGEAAPPAFLGARGEVGQAGAAKPRRDVDALAPRNLAKHAFRISHG